MDDKGQLPTRRRHTEQGPGICLRVIGGDRAKPDKPTDERGTGKEEKIKRLIEKGVPKTIIARRLKVNRATIYRFHRKEE